MTLNEEQEQQIIDWYNQGVTYKEIADEFGVSKSTIFNIIQDLRARGIYLPRRLHSKEELKEQNSVIIDLYKQGFSYKEIAKKIGVSYLLIESRITSLRKKGLITGTRQIKTSPEDLDVQYKKIATWYNHLSRREIADRLGISCSDVGNRIAALRKRGIITTFSKPGAKNATDRILELEKSISQNGYPKKEVDILINLYIKEGLYKDAIILLDSYSNYNVLSERELELISQIKSKLQSKILQEKAKLERER